ncbi:MAG: LemA family protein [Patescibacteria group bacterium]
MSPLLISIIVLAVIILWFVAVYNGLITARNRVKESWSDIDVQLKRRHDLIPNLLESVKGYMTHERELLTKITASRSEAMGAQTSGDTAKLAQAEGTLGNLLGNLRVAMEAYPDLKANTNIAQLMDELSDTENKIMASRRFYNANTRDFNTKMEVFPTNLIANSLKFVKFEFFEIQDPAEKANVQVKF